jgi:predicted RNA-binding Zn ribbon-like protein
MADMPAELALVESFLNSVDVDSGADDLDSVPRYADWLRAHHQPAADPQQSDLADARALRDALRAAARAHHDHASGPAGDLLDALTRRIHLRASFGPAGIGLEGAETGARGVLGAVLAAVVLAERAGTWRRVKICREDTCQWAFYDPSKNSSKQWCSMRVCGNRNKTRAYRARQRAD